jgi:predicted ribosome quality control (RQC) complex YloA/Tae2 family protein
MDGLSIAKVVSELRGAIMNMRLEKIYQPSKTEFEFGFGRSVAAKYLYLSTAPQALRIYLISARQESPKNPPAFCMLLRKHLLGGHLIEIKQLGTDREVALRFETRNEIGLVKTKTLAVELFGRHSNLILVDDGSGKIIDALKRVPLEIGEARTVFPGQKYEPIKTLGTVSLFDAKAEAIFEGLSQALPANPSADLADDTSPDKGRPNNLSKIQGFTNSKISELEGMLAAGANPKKLLNELRDFIRDGNGYSALLEKKFREKNKETELDRKKADLLKKLAKERKKLEKKIKNLDELKKDAEGAEEYKKSADLLLANLNKIKKGMEAIELTDFDIVASPDTHIAPPDTHIAPPDTHIAPPDAHIALSENGVRKIKLAPDKSPIANANAYYKKYHKLKASTKYLDEQRKEILEKIGASKDYDFYIENAASGDEIEALLSEMYRSRILIDRRKRSDKGRQLRPQKYREKDFLSKTLSSGKKVLVGRNNTENDKLTFGIADKDDLWFHAKDIPGSHVILRLRGSDASESDIRETASIAAAFSKGKDAGNLPVDYAKVSNVKKIKGSYLGNVTFKENRTVYA